MVLERLAELAKGPKELQTTLIEAGRLALEELSDPDRAVRNYRRLLEHQPSDSTALGGLVQALYAAGRPKELCDALEMRARMTDDRQAARRDRVRIARLSADELGDREAAIAVWSSIRSEFGAPDPQTFEALSGLYEAQENWESLIALIVEESRAEQQPERQQQLFSRLGELQLYRTGDPTGAVHAFAQAGDWAKAKLAAENALEQPKITKKALKALLKLATDAFRNTPHTAEVEARQAALWALRALAERLTTEGDAERAFDLLKRGSNLAFERGVKRELQREAAFLAADKLGGRDTLAIEMLGALFKEDSGDPSAVLATRRYAELLEQHGLSSERAELYQIEARRAVEPARACELWLSAAERWEASGNPERAIAAYEKSAELGSEAALEALARIYHAVGDPKRATGALDRWATQAAPDAKAPRTLQAAHAYLELGDRKSARLRFEQALAAGADVNAVRGPLGEIYKSERAFRPLAELIETQARAEWDPTRRAELLLEAVALWKGELKDPMAALPLLEQATEAVPDRLDLALELSELFGRAGRHADAERLLRQRLDAYGARRPRIERWSITGWPRCCSSSTDRIKRSSSWKLRSGSIRLGPRSSISWRACRCSRNACRKPSKTSGHFCSPRAARAQRWMKRPLCRRFTSASARLRAGVAMHRPARS